MSMDPPRPVLAGIDGSSAAIRAAQWAVDEAISRDVALRLVHVIHIADAGPHPTRDDFAIEMLYAEALLRQARRAVEDTSKPVKLETAVLHGDVDTVLKAESRDAAMICVGSAGLSWVISKVLGSAAARLANHTLCPVAIIRTAPGAVPVGTGRIAVIVDDEPGNGAVIQNAFAEACLRGTGVLAFAEIPHDELDRGLSVWANRYPEVQLQPVA